MVEVHLSQISHSYDGGKNWAVRDIDLLFESGKQYSLLGPSGCGKSTLLKIITGLIKPTKGKVIFDQRDYTPLPPEKRNVAIVFQFPVVYKMTVLENLLFPLLNIKISKEEKIKKAREIAALLKLDNLLKEQAQKLGPADRQRVAIGRALIREADVILLDEPMSSIEPDRKYEIKKLLLEIGRRFKRTMVFVTHDQTEALTFGEKIAVMSPNGRLLQFGTFEEIYHRPSHEFVGFFIGFPGMNILEAVYENGILNFHSFRIQIKLPFENNMKLRIGFRAEHVKISPIKGPDLFPMVVAYREDLGRDKYVLHLRSDKILVKAISETEQNIGETVWVRLPTENFNFFDESGKRLL